MIPERLICDYVTAYEHQNATKVERDRNQLDNSKDIITDYIEMLKQSTSEENVARTFWLILRYGTPNNFKLIFEWIYYELANSSSVEYKDNLGESQETLVKFILERNIKFKTDLERMIRVLKRREIDGFSIRPRKLLEELLKSTEAVEPQIDIRYQIPQLSYESLKKETIDYNSFKELIKEQGYIPLSINKKTNIQIYTVELALLFGIKTIELKNLESQEKETIQTLPLAESYAQGFLDGQQYFKDNFYVDSKTLYGDKSKDYIENLLNHYYRFENEASKFGWNFVKQIHPYILTHKEIQKYGYYAGLCSEADMLIAKHRGVFQNDSTTNEETTDTRLELNSIWINNPKVTIEKVLEKGFGVGIFDDQNKIQSKRNSLYGTGKSLLSAMYIALKGNSIKDNINYEIVGEKLCNFFHVATKPNVNEAYKVFQSAPPAKTKEFKKLFNLTS